VQRVTQEDRPAGSLQLIDRHGRFKYALLGRMVNGADPVELCFSGGWVTGCFEWSGEPTELPRFHYSIELAADGAVAQGSLEIPEGAVMRWPR
jgi:hypothetical protein